MSLQTDQASELVLAQLMAKFRSARLDAGLSQTALAGNLPVRAKAISEWETGVVEPELGHLILAAKEIGYRLAIVGEDRTVWDRRLHQRQTESVAVFERRRLAWVLRDRRQNLGMTQAELGRLVGVSRDSIQRWELGHVSARLSSLIVWAHKLGFTVALLPIDRSIAARQGWHFVEVNHEPSADYGVRVPWKKIYSRLCTVRRTAGLSEQELAERLGVAWRTVRDWERGYDRPSFRSLIGWAQVLGYGLAIVDPAGVPELPDAAAVVGELFWLSEQRRLIKHLRHRRVERGLSHADLALLLGLHPASVGAWEQLKNPPMVSCLLAYADRVGCRIELIEIEPEPAALISARRFGSWTGR